MEEIINRVASSQLLTIDLEDYCDVSTIRVTIDLTDQLYQGMVLREKDFREYIKDTDWSIYSNQYVSITCSADAIIPTWAYMLISSSLQPFTKKVHIGSMEELNFQVFDEEVRKVNLSDFQDKRIVIKGCGKFPIPDSCYSKITTLLLPVCQSIMYGEPCSTVPVYKRKKN